MLGTIVIGDCVADILHQAKGTLLRAIGDFQTPNINIRRLDSVRKG